MPLYVPKAAPSSGSGAGGGVSLEEVAEEVLNGLFCHYEPPTSEAAQRRAAEQVITGSYSADAERSVASSRGRRKSRGRSPARNRSTNSTRSASSRFDDNRDDVDMPPPPEPLRRRSKSILKESRLTRKSSEVNMTRSVTWRDQARNSAAEPAAGNGNDTMEERMASCAASNCGFMQDSMADNNERSASPDPIEDFRQKSPRAVDPNKKILYDDEGNPITDDMDEEDDILITPPPDDDYNGNSDRPHVPTRTHAPTQSVPPNTLLGSLYGFANSCGFGIGSPTKVPPTPASMPMPDHTTRSMSESTDGDTPGGEYDRPQSKTLPYRRMRTPPRSCRDVPDVHEYDDMNDSVMNSRSPSRQSRSKHSVSRRPLTPFKTRGSESWEDNVDDDLDRRTHHRRGSGAFGTGKGNRRRPSPHPRGRSSSPVNRRGLPSAHSTVSGMHSVSSSSTKVVSNKAGRNILVEDTVTPRGGLGEVDDREIASPREAYEKAVSPRSQPSQIKSSPFSKTPRKWRLGSKGTWKHADDVSLSSLQNMSKARKNGGKDGARGPSGRNMAGSASNARQSSVPAPSGSQKQQQQQQRRRPAPLPRRVERVPPSGAPAGAKKQPSASRKGGKQPGRRNMIDEVLATKASLRKTNRVSPSARTSDDGETNEQPVGGTSGQNGTFSPDTGDAAIERRMVQSKAEVGGTDETMKLSSGNRPAEQSDVAPPSRSARRNRDPTPRRSFASAVYDDDHNGGSGSRRRQAPPPTPRRDMPDANESVDDRGANDESRLSDDGCADGPSVLHRQPERQSRMSSAPSDDDRRPLSNAPPTPARPSSTDRAADRAYSRSESAQHDGQHTQTRAHEDDFVSAGTVAASRRHRPAAPVSDQDERQGNHAGGGRSVRTQSSSRPSSPTSMYTMNTDAEIREEVSSVGMESNTLRPMMHAGNPFFSEQPTIHEHIDDLTVSDASGSVEVVAAAAPARDSGAGTAKPPKHPSSSHRQAPAQPEVQLSRSRSAESSRGSKGNRYDAASAEQTDSASHGSSQKSSSSSSRKRGLFSGWRKKNKNKDKNGSATGVAVDKASSDSSHEATAAEAAAAAAAE